MKQFLALVLLFGLNSWLSAQIIDSEESIRDSLQEFGKREAANDSLAVHHPTIADYRYWKEKDLEKSIFDTALTIQSFYEQNFAQQDLFGKMYFPNFGQTFNPLSYEQNKFKMRLLPQGKSFNYIDAEDVKYYDVKTPMTEFVFENGLREGQYLSTTFAHNLTPRFNYSVRYRGLRSIGRYQNNIAANNALIAAINYQTKNERFKMWSHFATQQIDNDENAGIKDLNEFVHDDSLRTTNRQNIAVNMQSAYTEFDSRRFHLGTQYAIFKNSNEEKENSPLVLKNVFSYEKQKYFYHEPKAESYFTSALIPGASRRNLKNLESLQNTSTVESKWGERLLVEAGIRFEKLKLYGDEEMNHGLIVIPEQIEDNLLGGIGRLYFDWNDKIQLNAQAEFKSGKQFKNMYHLNAELDIQPLDGYHVLGGVLMESTFPSLNLFYHQSFYKDFNYHNYSFKNTQTQKLYGQLNLEKLNFKVHANFYNIDQYVYVDADFRPKQLDDNITLFQIQAENLLRYRKFHLKTTAQYQKITKNAAYLPLPEIIARASLYWQGKVFDNKAELQVGFNGNYFTEFESRTFFPVINEFMLQDAQSEQSIQKIGNFPILDFFINLKVDRMRIYIRADHFNSLWGENNYFSAPSTPFRDFKLQFGVKWYLFT